MHNILLPIWFAILTIIIPLHHSAPILSIPLHHKKTLISDKHGILHHPNTEAMADIYPTGEAYAMFLWVGTPVQIVFVTLDTGSPITWFQCDPCTNCYPMQRPPFNTRASTSFRELGCYSDTCLIPMMKGIFGSCTGWACRYNAVYQSSMEPRSPSPSRSFGKMVTETLNFEHSNLQVNDFIVGCGDSYEGPFRAQFAGVFGLGRGPLSVQSQLHAKAFSFCVVSPESERASSLEFYDTPPKPHHQHGNNGSIMVPLRENSWYPYYYFVQFVGIGVNGFMLDIQSRVWGYGLNYDGGVVVDTGTAFTYLPRDAYDVFRSEISRTDRNLTKRRGYEELDFCYKESETNVYPTVEFYFENGDVAGENFVSFKLDNDQLLLRVEEGTVCLAFAEAKNSALTVIGSNNLQGIHLMYDVVNEMLVFTYNKC